MKKEIGHIDVSIGGMHTLRFWPEGVDDQGNGAYVCAITPSMVKEAAQAGKYLEVLLNKEKK